MKSKRNLRSLAILLILPCLLAPVVHGQDTYTIAFNSSNSIWRTANISVFAPNTPSSNYQLILDAMTRWNLGALWFNATYHSLPYVFAPYKFILSQSRNASLVISYSNNASKFVSTEIHFDTKSDGITIVDAYFTFYYENMDAPGVTATLGVVLGLGRTTVPNDVMGPATTRNRAGLPSTLDFYALSVLWNSAAMPSSVTLPSNIPFRLVPMSAVPEFSNVAIVVFVLLLLSPLVLRRYRRIVS